MSDLPHVSPAEALVLMKDEAFTYVDVRTESEFESGHPEGAVNVPIMLAGPGGMTPNENFLSVMEKAFTKDTPLIIGCKASGRGARAALALTAAGFTRVMHQNAGWDGTRGPFNEVLTVGWSGASLPAGSGRPEGRTYADLCKKA